MAKSKSKPKSKKVLDEEEEIQEEPAEEAAPEEAEEEADLASDDFNLEEDEPVADDEDDEPQVKDDDDDESEADGSDSDDDDSIDAPAGPPPPRITKTAIALILLNWIAAPAFLYFAWADHSLRAQYSYRAMVNYVQIWGLPLKIEEDLPSLSNHTRPVQKFSSDELAKHFKARNTGVSVPANEPFVAIEEEVPLRLRPSDMSEHVLKDLFSGLEKSVPTLEDEIERLKIDLPAAINAAAKEVAAKFANMKENEKRDFIEKNLAMPGDPAAVDKLKKEIEDTPAKDLDVFVKRAIVQKSLFPLAWEVFRNKGEVTRNYLTILRVKKLDEEVNAAKGVELDKLVEEAVQRRLYYDVLAPIDVYRPADVGPDEAEDRRRFRVERIADRTFKVDVIEEHFQKRLGAAIDDEYKAELHIGDFWKKEANDPGSRKRDSIEKRKHVGFILFAVGQVQKPFLGKRLVDKGLERAKVVSGLHEFSNASIEYVRARRILDERIVAATQRDRRGWIITIDGGKKNTRTPGAIDDIDQEIDRIVRLTENIDTADKRRDEVMKEKAHFLKIYETRAQQHKEAIDRILKARVKTEELVQELRDKQAQLHEAFKELSDAGTRNFEIEAEIRTIELNLLKKANPKGGKKQ